MHIFQMVHIFFNGAHFKYTPELLSFKFFAAEEFPL